MGWNRRESTKLVSRKLCSLCDRKIMKCPLYDADIMIIHSVEKHELYSHLVYDQKRRGQVCRINEPQFITFPFLNFDQVWRTTEPQKLYKNIKSDNWILCIFQDISKTWTLFWCLIGRAFEEKIIVLVHAIGLNCVDFETYLKEFGKVSLLKEL